MTWNVLTEASPGAPRHAGINGDLCAVLDWALPQAGWAVEYSAGHARVYRPGSGNRNRLHVLHDSAVSGHVGRARVRGCEGASDATTLIDTFPTPAQAAASSWSISSNTAATNFKILVSETFVHYFSRVASDRWSWGFFGDAAPSFEGDDYATVVGIDVSSGSGSNAGLWGQYTSPFVVPNGTVYWCRDISGATRSSAGILNGPGPRLGIIASLPLARAGYQNRIYRDRIGVNDAASNSFAPGPLAIPCRAWLPNVWQGLYSGAGSITELDTFGDSAYDAAAVFRILSSGTVVNGLTPNIIVEETDTWSPP